ncbi:MAG TPA: sensor histidine kinase [Gemmatimonadaceae bacterium]|nr:sensor histidine kinase [Gemmatimonadaceae bacterium]
MQHALPSPLAPVLAARLRDASTTLTARWLERITAHVHVDPNRIFPTDELLDHIPLLLRGIADHLADPAHLVAADTAVVAHARELGALRHAQGFSLFEILKEYELLGSIVLAFLARAAGEAAASCVAAELFGCSQRVFHAIALVQEATAAEYLNQMQEKLAEREERLRQFNRTLTHELRNRIGAALGATQLLELTELPESKRRELMRVLSRSTTEMQAVLDNLLEISRVTGDARQQRHVRLPEAAREAVRELRDMAQAAGVFIRVAPDMPDCEVPAAAVELCLTNLIANAIKYADPTRPERWVEVRGYTTTEGGTGEREAVVEVRDNGIGVPADQRDQLFQRFFRVGEVRARGIEGSGLGLSIVRETVEGLGGRAWAEFPLDGSIFAFSLPCRREIERGTPGPAPTTGAEMRSVR